MNKILNIVSGISLVIISTTSAMAQDLRGGLTDPVGSGEASGWYIRGGVGLNAMSAGGLSQPDLAANGGSFIDQSVTNTASIDLGVGYRFNSKLRVDATWELRTGANLKAVDNVRILNGRGQTAADIYSSYDANIHSQVALVNAYYDIGTWHGFTPFVGASLGVARNTISGLSGVNNSTINIYDNVAPYNLTSQINETSSSYSHTKTRYNLAWGLSAGLGYAVNENLTLEASGRYLNLGSGASTSLINCTCGSTGQPIKVGAMESIDMRLGMRWNFSDAPKAAPMAIPRPVSTKF